MFKMIMKSSDPIAIMINALDQQMYNFRDFGKALEELSNKHQDPEKIKLNLL